MSIINYVDLFIGAVINMLLYIYTIKKIFDRKISKNKLIIILCIIFSSIFISIVNIFNKDSFKLLLTFPFIIITIKYSFFTTYNKSILYVIFSVLYLFLGEIILGIIFSILPFDYNFIFNNLFGTTIGAIMVAIITQLLLRIKSIRTKIKNIVENTDENSNAVVTVFIIMAVGIFAYKISNNMFNYTNLIINVIISIIFLIIIYLYYSENIKSKALSENYNKMLKYLEKYEKELNEKRKIIHDYKNELIIINGYIGDNKKLKEYVSEILEEQKVIKENSLINNIDKIPNGLKGLIYYKLSDVYEKIDININIGNSIKIFNDLDSKRNKQALKIVGILLDNAIEAVDSEKNRCITINLFSKSKTFIIIIKNTCTTKIDLKSITNIGFSTKGKNRGYGLSLINDILRKDKNMSFNVDVINDEFVANLKIKI